MMITVHVSAVRENQTGEQHGSSHARMLPVWSNFIVKISPACPLSNIIGARNDDVRLMPCGHIHLFLYARYNKGCARMGVWKGLQVRQLRQHHRLRNRRQAA